MVSGVWRRHSTLKPCCLRAPIRRTAPGRHLPAAPIAPRVRTVETRLRSPGGAAARSRSPLGRWELPRPGRATCGPGLRRCGGCERLVCSAAPHLHLPCVSLWYTFLLCDSGAAARQLGWGTTMDSTALQELIAQVRGTTTSLAEAEQRIASFRAELAPQDRGAQSDAQPAQPTPTPIAKRRSSGWVPAG
jgi:hypothetical protein